MRKLFKNLKERKVKLTSILLAFVFVVSSVIYTLASQKVTMSVTQVPNIDVLLAKSSTDANLTNFDQDLLAGFEEKGISKDTVQISTVEMQNSVSVDEFSWQTDYTKSYIGQIEIDTANSGKNIVMNGNDGIAGKNAIYVIPSGSQEQEFNFDYSIDYGESFNATGMLLKVQKTDTGLKGYMLSFNNSYDWIEAAGENNAAIWEFTFASGSNTSNFDSKTFKQGLNLDTSGQLNIKTTDKKIVITGGGLSSPVTYNLDNKYGYGYGFFSDHYSGYGATNLGKLSVSNITLDAIETKDFNDILKAQTWRDGSCRLLINVSDITNDQLNDNTEIAAIVSRFINNDIHFIGWGTDTNKSEMEKVISINDGNGIFSNNTDYTTAIDETTTYVKEIFEEIPSSNYVIVGEPVNIEISPSSEATNTADEDFPNGKWMVKHEYAYFENDEGQYEKSGVYTEDVITEFTKPGSYKIYYADELVTEIFAHRRPVASFKMQKLGSSLTLTDTAYDVDKQSEDNGIQSTNWSYQKIGTNTWTTGQLSSLETGNEYLVKFEVQDKQGTWSKTAKHVTLSDAILNPIAEFEIKNKTISVSDELEVIDSSYDPAGLDITSTWTVKKDGTQIHSGTEPLLNYETHGAGSYTMSLVVTNSSNLISEEVSRTFTVVADTTAPKVSAEKEQEILVNTDIKVNLTITDEGSGVKSYKYAITSDTNEPTSWQTVNNDTSELATFTSEVTISGKGKWYLHVKATDVSGNESEDNIFGIYEIKDGYAVEIHVFDEETGADLTGAKIQLSGEYRNGTQISLDNTVKTTDSTGKVKIENIPLSEVSTLRIANPTALAGYEQSETKIVTTDTTTEAIVVSKNLSSSNIETSVSSDGKTLTVKYPLSKKKFNLKVTTVDQSNENIKLSGAEYVLKYRGTEVATGKSVDGVVTLEAPIGLTTGVYDDYVLQQTGSVAGYNPIDNAIISASFEGDGSLIGIKYSGSKDKITIPNTSNSEIIVKNSRSGEGEFTVNVNVIDEENILKKVEGSKYSLKIETDQGGLPYTVDAKTSNSNGDIVFDNLYALGLIKITFIHEGAPTGYGISTEEKYITVENVDGNITYNEASTPGVFYKYDQSKKIIYTNLTNGKKASTNSIRINVYDGQNTSNKIEGVNFEIYDTLNSKKVGSGTTDENGILTIDNIKSDAEGKNTYTITPVNQSNTSIESRILFNIDFDKSGNAINAEESFEYTGVTVTFKEEDSEYIYRRIAEVDIATNVKEVLGETTLTITKKEAVTEYPIEGAQYRIRIRNKDDGSISTKTYTTDSNGEFTLNVPEATSLEIKLTEVKAAPGYTLDSTTKKLNLQLNSSGKLVPIESSYDNLDKANVIVDSANNIKINIIEEGESLRYPKVKFRIIKEDITGEMNLKGVVFRITNEASGYSAYATTDDKEIDGELKAVAEFPIMSVREAKEQIIYLEETQTLPGYELPNKPYAISIPFIESGNIIMNSGNVYKLGEELIKDINTKYDVESNYLEINIIIKNAESKDDSISKYDIDLIKYDFYGKATIKNASYKLDIRPYGMFGITLPEVVVTDQVEKEGIQLTDNKTTILLSEVYEGIGCGPDKGIKVITVVKDEDGTLSYDKDSTSNDLTVNIIKEEQPDGTIKQTLQVEILGARPEGDVLGLDSVTVTDGGQEIQATKTSAITYEVTVGADATETDLKIITKYDTSKVSINGNDATRYTQTEKIILDEDTVVVKFKVQNDDDTKIQEYAVIINKKVELGLNVQAENGEGATAVTIKPEVINDTTFKIDIPTEYEKTLIRATAVDDKAKVSINSGTAQNKESTLEVSLNQNVTTIPVKVSNASGTQEKTYSLIIVRAIGTQSVISNNLLINKVTGTDNGTEKAAKSVSATIYKLYISEDATETNLKVTTFDSTSQVLIEYGDTNDYSTASQEKLIKLDEDETEITVKVKAAEDPTSGEEPKIQEYKVIIIKGEEPTTPTQTAELGLLKVQTENEVGGVKIENIATQESDTVYKLEILKEYTKTVVRVIAEESTSKISINSKDAKDGEATEEIDLTEEITIVPIKVTNFDGTQEKSYSLVITKGETNSGYIQEDLRIQEVKAINDSEEKLASLKSSTKYEVTVSNNPNEVDLKVTTKDSDSEVSINGANFEKSTQTETITLDSDKKEVKVIVQNKSGETKEYTVVIVKEEEDDDPTPIVPSEPITEDTLLKKIENTESNGTVISKAYPIDNKGTYRIEVANTRTSTIVKVTAVEPDAKITIKTGSVQIGVARYTENMNMANKNVTIKIESADGSTSKTYTLELVKAKNDTGVIKDELSINRVTGTDRGSLVKATQTSSTDYNIKVDEANTYTDLTVIAVDATSQVSIDSGDFATSKQTLRVTLDSNTKKIPVVVKSASGEEQNYTVTVEKKYDDDESVPPEADPEATFVMRLYNRNDGETWARPYYEWVPRLYLVWSYKVELGSLGKI